MTLNELLNFIATEDKRLKKYFHTYSDQEKVILARTVKLMEEIGELSSEVLASHSLQRKAKLKKHNQKSLSWEFADVFITLALLAQALEVDIEKAVKTKIIEIEKRHKNNR